MGCSSLREVLESKRFYEQTNIDAKKWLEYQAWYTSLKAMQQLAFDSFFKANRKAENVSWPDHYINTMEEFKAQKRAA